MNTLSWKRILMEGVIAGALGYASIVLFFAASNVLAGRSLFYTPALLGSVLLYGVRDVSAVAVAAGPVIAFNGVAVFSLMLLGILIAFLGSEADRGPVFLYLAALALMLVVLPLLGIAIVAAGRFGDALPEWTVVAAAVLAVGVTLAYVFSAHPHLREELGEDCETA